MSNAIKCPVFKVEYPTGGILVMCRNASINDIPNDALRRSNTPGGINLQAQAEAEATVRTYGSLEAAKAALKIEQVGESTNNDYWSQSVARAIAISQIKSLNILNVRTEVNIAEYIRTNKGQVPTQRQFADYMQKNSSTKILKDLKPYLLDWDVEYDSQHADKMYEVYDDLQLALTKQINSTDNTVVKNKLELERQVLRYKRDWLNVLLVQDGE